LYLFDNYSYSDVYFQHFQVYFRFIGVVCSHQFSCMNVFFVHLKQRIQIQFVNVRKYYHLLIKILMSFKKVCLTNEKPGP
jgi:hypothetical protein